MLLPKDLKLANRVLWKERGFTLTAILTLSVCIAANAALFSIVNSVILTPLPVPDSDRIVLIYNSYPRAGVERAGNGVPDYYDRLRDLSDVFEEQALYNSSGLTIGEQGSPERVRAYSITPSFFRLLRVEAALGRTFLEEEGEPGNERKVVLSHALWQQQFGGDKDAVGRDLRVNGRPYTIVGVMPEDFMFLNPSVRLWIPLAFTEAQKSDGRRHSNNWEQIGRLLPGASLGQVRSQLDALIEANHELFPHMKQPLTNAGYNVRANFLKEEVVQDVRAMLYLLWGGVFVVLLIGAVNIANLVLARSGVKAQEVATRMAMGAGLLRIARQASIESLYICGIAGALGLGLGYLGLQALPTLGLDELPRGSEIAMDGFVVAVVAAMTLLVAALIAAIPILNSLRPDLTAVFRLESRTGTASRGTRLARSGLVAVQVAFAFVLLLGAGLLLESFRQVLAIDPGFRQGETVLTGRVSLPSVRYADAASVSSFIDRALERIRAAPGVVEAGISTSVPFGGNYSDSVILAEGYQMQPGESLVSPSQIVISTGYFEAMGISLISGRYFDERDVSDGPRNIIVDERLARKFWPDADAVGKRMFFPQNAEEMMEITEETTFFHVVGVVGSVKMRALVDSDERVGACYRPYPQTPRSNMTLVLKANGEPTALTASVRRAIAEIDPELPLFDVLTMQQRLDDSLTDRRAPVLVSLTFGTIALFLAAVGIYGVLAYVVAQRRREIGIRIALGSNSSDVFRLVLRQGIAVLGAGFGAGFVGVLALNKFLEGLLYGVRPLNPGVMLAVAGILALVAVAACAAPALRATRIDPVRALNAS